MRWLALAVGLGSVWWLLRKLWREEDQPDLVERLQALGWPVKRSERV
jgi:hypothetical protein